MKKILSKTLLTIKATALIAVFTLTHQKSFAARPEICTKPVPNPKTIDELYSCKRLAMYMGNSQYIALSKDYIKKNILEDTERVVLQNRKNKKTYEVSISIIQGMKDANGDILEIIPAFIIRHQKNQKYIQENIIINGVVSNFGQHDLFHGMSKAEVFQFLKYSQHDLVLFKAVIRDSQFFLLEMITDEEQYKHFLKEAKWDHLIFE